MWGDRTETGENLQCWEKKKKRQATFAALSTELS